jgi:beta-phosphoglucomutase
VSRVYGAIFDMDGVLVDSYWAHFASWKQLAQELGRTLSEEEFAQTFGRTSREILRQRWPDLAARPEELQRLDRRKEDLYRQIIRKQFPAMPGAAELLRQLWEANFRLAIASSGPTENVDLVLRELDVASLLHAVVTGQHVARGKPDPEVFLRAAEKLGLPAHRCVVVEDAPAGIEAARRAGMAVIGLVSTGRRREELQPADLVVESLTQLRPEELQALIDQRAP